jgi:hypothetical protein
MLLVMFVTTTKLAATVSLAALTCNGPCVAGHFSMQAEAGASIQALPPRDTDAKQPETEAADKDAKKPAGKIDMMFPDGLRYDFGKVTRGTQYRHSFRIVNTSNVPLHILSVRSA